MRYTFLENRENQTTIKRLTFSRIKFKNNPVTRLEEIVIFQFWTAWNQTQVDEGAAEGGSGLEVVLNDESDGGLGMKKSGMKTRCPSLETCNREDEGAWWLNLKEGLLG